MTDDAVLLGWVKLSWCSSSTAPSRYPGGILSTSLRVQCAYMRHLVSKLCLDFDDGVRGCSPDDVVEQITSVPLDACARVGDHGAVDRGHLVDGHSSGGGEQDRR